MQEQTSPESQQTGTCRARIAAGMAGQWDAKSVTGIAQPGRCEVKKMVSDQKETTARQVQLQPLLQHKNSYLHKVTTSAQMAQSESLPLSLP